MLIARDAAGPERSTEMLGSLATLARATSSNCTIRRGPFLCTYRAALSIVRCDATQTLSRLNFADERPTVSGWSDTGAHPGTSRHLRCCMSCGCDRRIWLVPGYRHAAQHLHKRTAKSHRIGDSRRRASRFESSRFQRPVAPSRFERAAGSSGERAAGTSPSQLSFSAVTSPFQFFYFVITQQIISSYQFCSAAAPGCEGTARGRTRRRAQMYRTAA
jgi:hypothetical protein